MESEHAERSLRRRGVQGALANKRAADSHAHALVSTIRELRGQVSFHTGRWRKSSTEEEYRLRMAVNGIAPL